MLQKNSVSKHLTLYGPLGARRGPWAATQAGDTVLQAGVWCFDRWQRCCDGNQDASGAGDGMHGTGEPATGMLQAHNPEVVAAHALRNHII